MRDRQLPQEELLSHRRGAPLAETEHFIILIMNASYHWVTRRAVPQRIRNAVNLGGRFASCWLTRATGTDTQAVATKSVQVSTDSAGWTRFPPSYSSPWILPLPNLTLTNSSTNTARSSHPKLVLLHHDGVISLVVPQWRLETAMGLS